MSVGALVFDLDGVIVKTNRVKYAAMLSLFSEHPKQQGVISEFILANNGVPRRVKLAHLLENVLRIEPTDCVLAEYLRRYAVQLEHDLAVAPMVEGVGEFIAHHPGARYICSSAPLAEVQAQVSRRSLGRHFAAVYGGATPKADALRAIAESHRDRSVIFFGDSAGDYEASRKAGIAFVGVICERDNFEGMPVVKLRDFTHRAEVEQAILLATQRAA